MHKLSYILSAAVLVTLSAQSIFAQVLLPEAPQANLHVKPDSNKVSPPIKRYGDLFKVTGSREAQPGKGLDLIELPAGEIGVGDMVGAINNNTVFLKALSVISADQNYYLASRRDYWPQPSASLNAAGLGSPQRAVYSALVNQNIFNWSALKTIAARRFARDASIFDSLTTKQQIEFTIVLQFYEVLKARAARDAEKEAAKNFYTICHEAYTGAPKRADIEPCNVFFGQQIPAEPTYKNDLPGTGLRQFLDLETATRNLIGAMNAAAQDQINYEKACHADLQLIGIQANPIESCDRFKRGEIPNPSDVNVDSAQLFATALSMRPDLNSQREQVNVAKQTASSFSWVSRFNLLAQAGAGNQVNASLYQRSGVLGTSASNSYNSPNVGVPIGSQLSYYGVSLNVSGLPSLSKNHQANLSIVRQNQLTTEELRRAIRQQVDDNISTINETFKIESTGDQVLAVSNRQLKEATDAYKLIGLFNAIDFGLVVSDHATVQAGVEASKLDVLEAIAQQALVTGREQ